MTNRIITKAALVLVAAGAMFAALTPATLAADPFMAIHLDNQKIGSDVYTYWQGRLVADETDGFMPIHLANQEIGSEVSAFWSSLETDGFMAIHMANQAIGSDVAAYWREFTAVGTEVEVADGSAD